MSTGHLEPMTRPPERRARAVQRSECGEHLCSFSTSDEEHRRLAAAFVASALGAGDRVVYAAGSPDPADVARRLTDGGMDVAEALRTGQLGVLDLAAIRGAPPDVALDTVLLHYREEAERTRAAGYPGLRLAVEMRAVIDALGSVDLLPGWERAVGRLFAEAGITAVCQYDAREVDGVARERIVAEHAAVGVDDGTAPIATFRATETPAGLRVAGELDITTAPRFARALRARASVSRRIHVDVRDVTFADLAGIRTVYEVAAELAPDSALVLDGAPPRLRRLLDLVAWREPRVEVRPL